MSNHKTEIAQQLIEAREAIETELARVKKALRDEAKTLQKIEKLDITIVADRPERIAKQNQLIDDLVSREAELQRDLKEAQRTKNDDDDERVEAALNTIKTKWLVENPSCAYVIEDQAFTFIRDYSEVTSQQNVQQVSLIGQQFVELLSNELKIPSWDLPLPRVKNLFNNIDHTFQMSRYSVQPQNWKKNQVYLPMVHMEPHFISNFRVEDDADQESMVRYFDWLMYSLSGNRAENQNHIEQWVLHKIKNYQKAASTPDIVIVGHVGGNGKGVFQNIMRLTMPSQLVGIANTKTLNGSFNNILLGKLIAFFDDQNAKEIPLEVIKQLSGSTTMIFEQKGKDQYEGEKTYSAAFFSNVLPFKLTPAGKEGGVDRRFSIMRTNITLLESIKHHAELENPGCNLTVDECKEFANYIINNVFNNRTMIARWFKHLERKHPQVNRDFNLKALHGSDYKYFLSQQRDGYEAIWSDLIEPIISAGGCVPMFVVKELLRHSEGRDIGEKTIQKRLDTLAAEHNLAIDYSRTSVNIIPSLSGKSKQCSAIHPKEPVSWTSKNFDWTLVSKKKYIEGHSGELIPEDDLMFGINDDAVDMTSNISIDTVGTTSEPVNNTEPEIVETTSKPAPVLALLAKLGKKQQDTVVEPEKTIAVVETKPAVVVEVVTELAKTPAPLITKGKDAAATMIDVRAQIAARFAAKNKN